jgi:hypothetical protein
VNYVRGLNGYSHNDRAVTLTMDVQTEKHNCEE